MMKSRELQDLSVYSATAAAAALLLAFPGDIQEFIGDGTFRRYALLLPSLFSLGLSAWIVNRRFPLRRHHLALPSFYYLLISFYFLFFGSLDHLTQVLSGAIFLHLSAIPETYAIINISLLAWVFGYIIVGLTTGGAPRRDRGSSWRWNMKRLQFVGVSWAVLGVAAFIGLFRGVIGESPALAGIGPFQSEIMTQVMGAGNNLAVVAFNASAMALLFSGTYLAIKGPKISVAIAFGATLTCFLLWGARVLFVLPLLMIMMLHVRIRRPSLTFVLVLGAVGFAAAVGYGVFRSRVFFTDVLSGWNGSIVDATALSHFSPEFRDTLGVVEYLRQLQFEYGTSSYLKGVYLTALPDKVWGIFGIDKTSLFMHGGDGSGFLIAQVTRGITWGGVRGGLLAQTLMAFGVTGVVVVFALIGAAFSYLDRKSVRLNPDSPQMVYTYILAVLLGYIIGTTHSMFSKVWYFSYGFAITLFLAADPSGSRGPDQGREGDR